MTPIQRVEISWSQRPQFRVLVFLYHYQIPVYLVGQYDEINRWGSRTPTEQAASEIYGVPQRTISNWVRKQEMIESCGYGKISHTVVNCQWPELESKLYGLFLERREQSQAIRTGWFQIHSLWTFREQHLEISEDTCRTVFQFSDGWVRGFLGRFRISLRCITKKAQGVPEDYRQLVVNLFQFNRPNYQSTNWLETVLCHAVGQYDLRIICNPDETTLPFEYLNARTYNSTELKNVWVKKTRSG